MDGMPSKSISACCSVIYKTLFSQEFSSETVVPDVMPDIDRILDTKAQICIRSKTVSDGEILLEGSVLGTVLYVCQEDDTPRKLESTIPLRISCQDKDIAEGDILVSDTVVSSAEARLINPRKILFRAETDTMIETLRAGNVDISTAGADAAPLEKLTKTVDSGFISAVRDKTFTVSDEIDLSEDMPLAELLTYQVQLFSEDLKKVGGKMIIQGGVELSLLYLAEENDCPCSVSRTIPFSQIVDVPEEEIASAAVRLSPVSCYIEPIPGLTGCSSVSAEIHICAQVVCTGWQEMEYIADAYSLHHPCHTEYGEAQLPGKYESVVLRQAVQDQIELPEPAERVIYARVTPLMPVPIPEGIRVPFFVRAVYSTQSGKMYSVSRKLQTEFSAPHPQMEGFFSQPSCKEISAYISQNGIDIRFEGEIGVLCADMADVSFVRSVQLDNEELQWNDAPSMVVLRPGGRSVWELAKSYCSTCELIKNANPGEISPDRLLLIPRGR